MHGNSDQRRSDVRSFPGRTFDGAQFTVVLDCARAVGKGGTAKIYKSEIRGCEPCDVTHVAVKVFDQVIGDVDKELLLRELRATRQIASSHSLILGFLGTADVGPEMAIVSQYMRNGNLMEYIKAHQGCDKTSFIRQVAEALNFLHTEKNLVHGDIKSANVLISNEGKALLADFGLSTFIEQDQAVWPTMPAIHDMYTLRFAAPELITGGGLIAGLVSSEFSGPPAMRQRSKTRESDVYAFGMLILEVVTESPPWHGLNHAAVVLRVATGQHPPRPLVALSQAAWELCLRCWRTDPAERINMEDALEVCKANDFSIAPGAP